MGRFDLVYEEHFEHDESIVLFSSADRPIKASLSLLSTGSVVELRSEGALFVKDDQMRARKVQLKMRENVHAIPFTPKGHIGIPHSRITRLPFIPERSVQDEAGSDPTSLSPAQPESPNAQPPPDVGHPEP